MDWVIVIALIPLILLVFSFGCSVPFLDRICQVPIIKQSPSVGVVEKGGKSDA